MKRRLVALVAVVAATAGGVAVAQRQWSATGGGGGGWRQTRMSLPATGLGAVPICPGPQTLVAPSGTQPVALDGPVTVAGVVEGTASSPAGQATLAGRALQTGNGSFGVLSLPRTSAGPVPLRPSRSASAPPMSAVQFGLTRSGDRRGLAGLTCSTASTRIWLVGGGTRVGRRGRLLLANPAAAPAEVDVTVHGPRGVVEAPSGLGVVVPAESQTALRIDALAPELDAVAVRVQARSGRVSASLHDTYVRGSTPSGADDVTAAAPAAVRQVVPGVSVAPAAGMELPSSATDPGAVAVRVVNPGAAELVARVTLLGDAGELVLPDGVVTVGPGEVRDVPVTEVLPGLYSAVVVADAPVVAGALVGRTVPGRQIAGTGAGAGSVVVPPAEFGWAAGVEPLAGTSLVALPELAEGGRRTGVRAVLSVAAPDASGSVEIVELDAGGGELGRGVLLTTAGSGAQWPVRGDAAAIRLRPVKGSGPLAAALVLTVTDAAGPMIAVLPVRPGPTGSGARPHVVSDVRVGLPS